MKEPYLDYQQVVVFFLAETLHARKEWQIKVLKGNKNLLTKNTLLAKLTTQN